MLTGRPPFHGATLIETLEQVWSREPVSPRALHVAAKGTVASAGV